MADYKGREGVAGSVRSKSEHGFRRGLGGLSLSASFSKSTSFLEEVAQRGEMPGFSTQRWSVWSEESARNLLRWIPGPGDGSLAI